MTLNENTSSGKCKSKVLYLIFSNWKSFARTCIQQTMPVANSPLTRTAGWLESNRQSNNSHIYLCEHISKSCAHRSIQVQRLRLLPKHGQNLDLIAGNKNHNQSQTIRRAKSREREKSDVATKDNSHLHNKNTLEKRGTYILLNMYMCVRGLSDKYLAHNRKSKLKNFWFIFKRNLILARYT